mgnify:CR=1 FL=1
MKAGPSFTHSIVLLFSHSINDDLPSNFLSAATNPHEIHAPVKGLRIEVSDRLPGTDDLLLYQSTAGIKQLHIEVLPGKPR